MITRFVHHPDGIIYIDGGSGRVALPLAEFMIDEPDYPSLPDGIAGFVYEPGRRHAAFDIEGNTRAGTILEATLDGYIAKAATYAASMAARHAPPALTFGEIKTSALASVDRAAEAARLRWVTPGEVKQAIYTQKAAEADRLAQDADPDPADYPLLAPEAAARGLALTEFGAVVRSTRDTWLAVAGQIEASAVTAKAAISAAADAAAVQAILDNLSWPAPPA